MARQRVTLLHVEVDADWRSLALAVVGVLAMLWLAYWWVMA